MKKTKNFFAHQITLSASIATGIVYIIYAAIIVFLPEYTYKLTASLLHMRSLEPFMPYIQVTGENVFSGVVQATLYTYGFVMLMLFIYKKLSCENNDHAILYH